MNKLSSQEEQALMIFIKDWLKNHGYTQKDLANELKISSSRTSEILKKIKEFNKKGGLLNIANKLIAIEHNWVTHNSISSQTNKMNKSHEQLGIDYQLDIDALMDQMEKDHQN